MKETIEAVIEKIIVEPETTAYLTEAFTWTTKPEKENKIAFSYSFKGECWTTLSATAPAFPQSRAVQDWLNGEADPDDAEDLRKGIKDAIEYALGCDLCGEMSVIRTAYGLQDPEDREGYGDYCAPDAESLVKYGGDVRGPLSSFTAWKEEVRRLAEEDKESEAEA